MKEVALRLCVIPICLLCYINVCLNGVRISNTMRASSFLCLLAFCVLLQVQCTSAIFGVSRISSDSLQPAFFCCEHAFIESIIAHCGISFFMFFPSFRKSCEYHCNCHYCDSCRSCFNVINVQGHSSGPGNLLRRMKVTVWFSAVRYCSCVGLFLTDLALCLDTGPSGGSSGGSVSSGGSGVTAAERDQIVAKHNDLRRHVHPPASNMLKMVIQSCPLYKTATVLCCNICTTYR